MTNVEIFNISFLDKKTDQKLALKDDFLKNLYDGFSLRFPNFINDLPAKDTYDDVVQVKAVKNKTEWFGQSVSSRVAGTIIVGRDKELVLDFSKDDIKKSAAGGKDKGLAIDRHYYFDLVLPKDKSIAYLILERTKSTSCRKHIFKMMKLFIKKIDNNVKLKFENFIEKDLVTNFLGNGVYNEIEFIRQDVPRDLLERYMGDYINNGKYIMSTSIIALKDSDFSESLKKDILDSIENNKSFFSVPSMEKQGFDKGKSIIKIKSEFKGKTRKIDLSDTMKIQPYYPIDDVSIDEKGFVDFKEMRKKVTSLLKSLDLDIL